MGTRNCGCWRCGETAAQLLVLMDASGVANAAGTNIEEFRLGETRQSRLLNSVYFAVLSFSGAKCNWFNARCHRIGAGSHRRSWFAWSAFCCSRVNACFYLIIQLNRSFISVKNF